MKHVPFHLKAAALSVWYHLNLVPICDFSRIKTEGAGKAGVSSVREGWLLSL